MKRAFAVAVGVLVGAAAVLLVLQLVGVDVARVITRDVDKGTVIGKLSEKAELTTASRSFRTTVERNLDCETDLKILSFTWPQELCGQTIRLNVDGDVDAVINLEDVAEDGVTVDGDTVRVVLPPPTLTDPTITNVDLLTDDRGLKDRVGDFFSGDTEQSDATLDRGRKQIAQAAQDDAEFQELARTRAESLLEDLLSSAGVEKVVVTFDEDAVPRS